MSDYDLNDKAVLLTGGTGSFGKAFTSFLIDNFKLKRLMIFSRDEQKHFEMKRKVSQAKFPIQFVIGDVRDFRKLKEATKNVQVVVHAAAMKHMPMAEDHPLEAVKTNIIGSQNLITACIENNVERVIALSTDKSVLPTNAYGSTKLLMERLFVLANMLSGNTKFTLVRYANVFGSKGSVIPLFLKLKSKGILPITDPEMTRFSITMQQGIDLVIFAILKAWGGEVVVPITPSYKVGDVANAVCDTCTHNVIGPRAAEKMHEILFSVEESLRVARRNNFFIICPREGNWTLEDYCGQKDVVKLDGPFEYNSGSNSEWLTIKDIKMQILDLTENGE